MAPTILNSLFILLIIISSIPQSISQSISPQNIQTFYPLTTTTPPPPPSPLNDPTTTPPLTTPVPPPGGGSSSTRSAVGRAIGITAASTIVLSALVFFLLFRRSRRKRNRASIATIAAHVGMPNNNNNDHSTPAPPQNDPFAKFNGNLKGVIVDENGLDVVYWRDMEAGEKRKNLSSFKKQSQQQHYKNLRDDNDDHDQQQQKEDEKRIVSLSGSSKKYKPPPVQEVPLLRGKSSSSQSLVWVDKQDHIIKKTPSLVQLAAVEAVPKEKMVAPPPPQQLAAVEAVPKGKTAAAPPPPPPPINKSPAPPPPPPGALASSLKPPPPPSRRSASEGEGTSKDKDGQVKLKPLHWDKVNPNAQHSMVWDKLDKGSFKFDGDMMEALFGYVATNRKSPQRDNRATSPPGPPSQIFILDTRKSQNTAIVLKSLGLTRKEIIDSLIDGHGLNPETIEKLAKISPTDEEKSQILSFNGDPTRLADAESFLYHLLKAVPSAFTRFETMLFRSNYDSEVLHVKESLKSLESACNELRTRGLFLKLLEAVLKAGNRLNAGTSRGNAQAFNLTALTKLSDVKSSDGKTTLLQFVVQEVVRAEGKRCVINNPANQTPDSAKDDKEKEYMMLGLPVIGGLSSEFTNVKKAAVLDYESLVKTISELSKSIEKTREMVGKCGNDKNGGFGKEMNGFLNTAEMEMRVVKEEETRVMELVKQTRDYYQAGYAKDKGGNGNNLMLFVIVRDFLMMVDQVCVDIARNLQKRRVGSPVAGSSTPGSGSGDPRVFRFPKLPANFMSDSSRSGSSDDDDDSGGGSEVRLSKG